MKEHQLQLVTVWNRAIEKRGWRCSCGGWEHLPEPLEALNRWDKPTAIGKVRARHRQHVATA